MSGIFGILNPAPSQTPQNFIEIARQRLSHRPWYTHDQWVAPDAPVALGRSGIGILNASPQPVISPDARYILFLSGEFYNRNALWQGLGHSPDPSQPDEALALKLYQAHGPTFAERINGVFFIALYDTHAQRLLLANDRFGQYPHYVYHDGRTLVFGPEVKAVLAAQQVPKRLNQTAVAEYFRFQQLLDRNTFHEGIQLFPHGSIAQFDLPTGAWQVQRYWDWDKIPAQRQIPFAEAVEETGHLLQNAVHRDASDALRPGVFLSGGLDSRTLLGMIPPRDTPPVSASFGQPQSRDVHYAKQIAQAVGSRHYWFDMSNAEWIKANYALHLDLTEGFHSWIHMHGIHMLPDLRAVMDVNLTGWDGGTVMGHPDHIKPLYNQPIDQWSVLEECFLRFNQSYTWPGLTEVGEQVLFAPAFAQAIKGRAYGSMAQSFSRYWENFHRPYAAEFFYVDNHCMRLTQHMVTTGRSHLEFRFPFWDYDLIDFMYSLPPEHRADQRLYRHIITQRTPKLARIPYDKQEFLPSVNPLLHTLQSIGIRTARRLKLHPHRPWLYADYENYLRTDLSGWAEDILFNDPRLAERGIFNMDYVRSLLNRHKAHEPLLLGKIAPIISFELMLRALFD